MGGGGPAELTFTEILKTALGGTPRKGLHVSLSAWGTHLSVGGKRPDELRLKATWQVELEGD